MQNSQLAEQIRTAIEGLLSAQGRPREFALDQSLFESGLLDSVAAIRLITELESRFGLRVDGSITMQRLDSLEKILETLEQCHDT